MSILPLSVSTYVMAEFTLLEWIREVIVSNKYIEVEGKQKLVMEVAKANISN